MGEWAAAYDADPRATFFHGPRWARLVCEYEGGGYRPGPVVVELEGGSAAVLGITMSPTGVPGVRRRLLSPYGCPGGWVAAEPLAPAELSALASLVCRGEVIWRIGPADESIPDSAVEGARAELTHVVDLRRGAAAARASWDASARRRVGRAARDGLTVRAASTQEDWDAYRRLYRRTVARWDSPLSVYDDSLFQIVPRVAGDEALLMLGERGGEVCAGALMFLHGRTAVGWHGSSDVQGVPGSFNAVQWEALALLESRGIETYDLLGSGPLAGVVAFKQSIGGVPTRVRAVVRSHSLVAAARAARRVLPARSRRRSAPS
jgi:hypothetical protein